jgi:hypothetical protein
MEGHSPVFATPATESVQGYHAGTHQAHQPSANTPPVVAPPAIIKKKQKKPEDRVLLTRTPDEETEDGRVRNREAVRKIRDTWIYKQVRARQDEFTNYRQVRAVNFVVS